MTITKLRSLLPPPSQPGEVPREPPWRDVEEQVGPLPPDYKQFIEIYGSGVIDDFVVVLNPFSENPHFNLLTQAKLYKRAFQEEVTEPGAWRGLPVDVNQLRPFGRTDNGDILAWKAVGAPEEWTVVVLDARGPYMDEFDGGFSEFLATAIAGELESDVLPEDFPSDSPAFKP